jgi:excisionase family DNA binding protein
MKKGSCTLLEDIREDQGRLEKIGEHSGIQGDKAAGRGKSAWLTPAEAVEESGIGRTRLYGFLTSGALPSAKVGRTRHIRRRDLERFLEERMTGNAAAPGK